jgi:hypothetical protein
MTGTGRLVAALRRAISVQKAPLDEFDRQAEADQAMVDELAVERGITGREVVNLLLHEMIAGARAPRAEG